MESKSCLRKEPCFEGERDVSYSTGLGGHVLHGIQSVSMHSWTLGGDRASERRRVCVDSLRGEREGCLGFIETRSEQEIPFPHTQTHTHTHIRTHTHTHTHVHTPTPTHTHPHTHTHKHTAIYLRTVLNGPSRNSILVTPLAILFFLLPALSAKEFTRVYARSPPILIVCCCLCGRGRSRRPHPRDFVGLCVPIVRVAPADRGGENGHREHAYG